MIMINTVVTTARVLILVAASALLLAGSPLRASDTDDRSESSAKKFYVVKHSLTNDASITAQVKLSLLSHPSTSALKAKVETIDGVVTLTGFANNATEKTLVTKLATHVIGVSNVVNNMIFQAGVSKGSSPLLPPQNLRIVSK